jgi:enoyl-CoA hydratase
VALVTVEKADGVALVTMDRPDAMNALSRALQAELAAAFLALDREDDVRVLILTGAGTRAFTAGLDLKELGQDAAMLGAERSVESDCVFALEQVGKPVIGAINGVAITGGFELALTCDILIASSTARFADTHARVGVMPGWGLSQKLSRAIGIYRAKEVSLSGNFVDAETALAWGLVNRVVGPADLLATARRLATDIASAAPDMVRRYKALIDEGFGMPLAEAMRHERAVADASNPGLDPAAIEARRAAVQNRGRAQA